MRDTVSILGLGLMGGSLGLALHRHAPHTRVIGWARRPETRAEALRIGAITEAADDPASAVRSAGIVVLCGPVRALPELARACASALPPQSVVTDVGSTKAWVESSCAAALKGSPATFIGSHPMAGSERTGLAAARADLYDGARVIVTGGGEPAERVEALWRSVGARVIRMSAAAHDALAARVSHGPHLAAALAALSAVRPGADYSDLRDVAGPGFRDTTRVADGSADIWTDVVSTNAGPVLEWLDACAGAMDELRQAVKSERWEDVRAWLQRARDARRSIVVAEKKPECRGGESTHA